MELCNCNIDLEAILCDIPSHWRRDIIRAICKILDDISKINNNISCAGCETVTSLSDFTIKENVISISHTNEKHIVQTSSVDISTALDSVLNNLDVSCFMSVDDWQTLGLSDKFSLLLQGDCECCGNTTTTTSSTTTTTTVAVCSNIVDILGSSGSDSAIPAGLYFWGWQDTNTVLTDSEIASSPNFATVIPGSDLTADFSGGDATPQYLWMAEPATEPEKTLWQDTLVPLNNNSIGSPTDLFDSPIVVGFFRFYITVYPTQQDDPIQFKIS